MSVVQVHVTNGTNWLSVIGPFVASGVALLIAGWSEWNRRRDKDSDLQREQDRQARSVIVYDSANTCAVLNGGSAPILDVRCISGRSLDFDGGWDFDLAASSDWERPGQTSALFIRAGKEFQVTGKEWTLINPQGSVVADKGRHEPRSAKIEWTDSHGVHWQRDGVNGPVRLAARTPATEDD